MKYKLIASDFDGTMYTGTELPEHTLKMIAAYRRAGGKFVLATGRIYSSIKQWLNVVQPEREVIACQGSCIYDGVTDAAIKRFSISAEVAAKALTYLESKGEVCQCYFDESYCTSNPNLRTDLYAKYCNVTPFYTGVPMSEYVRKYPEVNKIVGIVPAEVMRTRIADLQSVIGASAEVSQSSDVLLEVVSADAGKGNALAYLANSYGIDASETVAVGDNLNDISMIRFAGLGVAVGNALPEVKAAADYVTDTVDKAGVGTLIEKILDNAI